jgi:hypothetical protein
MIKKATGAVGQLSLFTAETPALPAVARARGDHELREFLTSRLGSHLTLRLTRNRQTILSFREQPGRLDLRLHQGLAAAPAAILLAVVEFVAGRADASRRRAALTTLRGWFATLPGAAAARPLATRPTAVGPPAGAVHDLAALRDALVRTHFSTEMAGRGGPVTIGWGRDRPQAACRRAKRRGGGHIRLGSYSATEDLIRIHPRLDRSDVPAWVVASVIHHELLHAVIPTVTNGGRRVVHGPEFRRRERLYPDHQRATRWIRENLNRLLR